MLMLYALLNAPGVEFTLVRVEGFARYRLVQSWVVVDPALESLQGMLAVIEEVNKELEGSTDSSAKNFVSRLLLNSFGTENVRAKDRGNT